ncbi:hypothetical protein B0H13DRAFT_1890109 [Mycena leptocephala]|nr:hypothetical protein B0H13DRAFT_1890109 [Mycena leptocephala]
MYPSSDTPESIPVETHSPEYQRKKTRNNDSAQRYLTLSRAAKFSSIDPGHFFRPKCRVEFEAIDNFRPSGHWHEERFILQKTRNSHSARNCCTLSRAAKFGNSSRRKQASTLSIFLGQNAGQSLKPLAISGRGVTISGHRVVRIETPTWRRIFNNEIACCTSKYFGLEIIRRLLAVFQVESTQKHTKIWRRFNPICFEQMNPRDEPTR